MSLIRNLSFVSSGIFLSRILGFIRDIILANKLGSGLLADVFIVAFKLPNLFRRLFAEGAMNSVFVPIYSSLLSKGNKEDANNLANNILFILFLFMVTLTILMQYFMPEVINIIAPGFHDNKYKFDLTVNLAIILFPYLIIISLIALLSSILNSNNKFKITSMAPVLLNIGIIIGALLYSENDSNNIVYSISYMIILTSIIQLIIVLYACYKIKFKIRFRLLYIDNNVKDFFKKLLPSLIANSVVQLGVFIDTIIATYFVGAVSYLYYSDRLNQLPLAVIGTALTIVILPKLSKYFSNLDIKKGIDLQNKAINFAMMFTIPASTALILLNHEIIYTIFYGGKFTNTSVDNTSLALQIYAIALPAMVFSKILLSILFAIKAMNLAMKISFVCIVINITASIILSLSFGYIGIVIATTITNYINLIILSFILYRKGLFKLKKEFFINLSKYILSSIVMLIFLFLFLEFGVKEYIYSVFSLYRYIALLLLITVSLLIYFISLYILKVNYKSLINV